MYMAIAMYLLQASEICDVDYLHTIIIMDNFHSGVLTIATCSNIIIIIWYTNYVVC